jgi:hypothetical protein
MKTLILNSSNIVSGSNNSELVYSFPSGSVQFQNDEVAVSTISMYYSWFNIDSTLYGNNVYQYRWLGSTFTVTIPNGNYSIAQLNAYLQFVMIQNGHYLVNSSSQNVYYLEFTINPSLYVIEFTAYPIPTALPLGWSNPAAVVFPLVAETPQVIILSNGFRDIIGFNSGTYPPVVQSTTYTKTSDFTPQVTPVNSLVMECSLINNNLSIPSRLLFSFTPQNTSFGAIMTIQPPEYTWNSIQNGFYNQFSIKFLDQNLRNVKIQDPQIVVLLAIKKSSEVAMR